jgi:hypothetical protein
MGKKFDELLDELDGRNLYEYVLKNIEGIEPELKQKVEKIEAVEDITEQKLVFCIFMDSLYAVCVGYRELVEGSKRE